MHQGLFWFDWQLFVSGSLVWSKPKLLRVTVWEISPNVVHILVMFDSHDPCLDDNDDIIDDANTRPQEALRILQFPFDDSRCDTLFSTPLLVVTFLVHRYSWTESGTFVFLSAEDHFYVSAKNWAAWNEYSERLTDDRSDLSPHLGVAVQRVRLQRA